MSVWKRKDTKKNPWQARWSDKDGKEHTKHFPTKAQAVTFEAKMLNEVSQGYFSDPLHAKTKLSNVYADWLPSTLNLKPKTRASYLSLWKCLVEPYWGNRQLQTITRSDIKIWVIASKSSTGKIVSPSRMKQAYVLLKLLLDHAVDMNLIGRSPILSGSKTNLKSLLPKNSMQSERRVLENIELRKLAEEVGEYAPLILLAGLVGLRWAELVALTPADLDFKTQTISVNKSVTEVDGKFEIVSTKTGQQEFSRCLLT
jgi:integrase